MFNYAITGIRFEAGELVIKCEQNHVLQYWDQLSDDQKDDILNDMKLLDIEKSCLYYKKACIYSKQAEALSDDSIRPLPTTAYASSSRTSESELQKYRNIGLEEISKGHVGVILLAGGQGTRIGVSYPKGMFKVGIPSGKSLFHIQAERLLKLESLAFELTGQKSCIKWFIMTSEHTKEPTRQYFEKENYFGLDKSNIFFFNQGLLPCFTFDGKIILESKCRIAKAPDGNGGIYTALKKEGILDEMEKSGIKYVHVYGVDNILVKVADPTFMGYCIDKKSDCGVKVIEKKIPSEGVGVVCVVDGKYKVVEYSEISENITTMRDADGRLTFRAGNICNHFFTLDFLKFVEMEEIQLHMAKKKIPFIDDKGNTVKPETPNGIKIEKFIFDVFEFSSNFVVWEGEREEEFSALKNSNAANSENPTTACLSVYNLHKKYIERAGGKILPDKDGNIVCEISPLVSYDGEGLTSKVSDKTFESPVLLQ